jgi:methanogenic corrinoid protein MtbC1
MIAYRSRAVSNPTQGDLDLILATARRRNRREGVTGLLIYQHGCFFQWLEGPPAAVVRVWRSIRQDARHRDVEILREAPISKRFFAEWDMRLVQGHEVGEMDAGEVAVPPELLRRLRVQNSGLTHGDWDLLFSKLVIPSVSATLPGARPVRSPTPLIWHARQHDGLALVGTLREADGDAVAHFVDRLVAEGAEVESLYHEVFEPAARCLGGMLENETLNSFDIAVILARLQVEVRRLSIIFAREGRATQHGHSILVATNPGEPHALGAAMASELFWNQGWNVNCQFPGSERSLSDLVRRTWYDVLELTLSNSVRRDQQLHALRLTIRAARAASLNPEIAVIVEGRTFHESAGAHIYVGADAGFVSVVDAEPAARRLLESIAARIGPVSRAAGPAATSR